MTEDGGCDRHRADACSVWLWHIVRYEPGTIEKEVVVKI